VHAGNLQFTGTDFIETHFIESEGAAMPRQVGNERLAQLLIPRLQPGEEIVGQGAAWFARIRGSHRLFVGRHYVFVALTDRRLLAFSRGRGRRRAKEPQFDASLDSLRLVRAGGYRILTPVLIDTYDRGRAVFEFRPRERALGRTITAALSNALASRP
jgi:hypothetical protein